MLIIEKANMQWDRFKSSIILVISTTTGQEVQRINDRIVTINKKIVIYLALFERCQHLRLIKLPENHGLLTAVLPLKPILFTEY